MELNKKELLYIYNACKLPEGVFDFDNYTDDAKGFKRAYGINKSEINHISNSLKVKVKNELKNHDTSRR